MSGAKLKLGISTALWGNPSGDALVPCLHEMKSLGYNGVTGFAEWGWQDYIVNPAPLQAALVEADLALVSIVNSVHADFDQHRHVCDFMQALNCHHLTLIGGNGKQPGDFAAVGALLNYIGELALQRGVRASYHHHSASTGETFKDMTKLMACTDPARVFAMLDTGHATRDFVELPIKERAVTYLNTYWDRLDIVELKDWHPETDLSTPVGEGECDHQSVFACLLERGYCGWLVVEQNGVGTHSRGRTPAECARLSRDYIRRSVLEPAIQKTF